MIQQPNILFFFPDQHRGDWFGTSALLPLRMPHLNRLAARGVRFTRAFTPSPLCAPARACLASGREYDACGVRGNGMDYPLGQVTYYRLLRDAGYHVSGCGKFDLHKATYDWGLDGRRLLDEWGFSSGIDNEGKLDAIASGAEAPRGPYMAYLHNRGLAAAHVRDMRERGGYLGTAPTPLPEEAYCDNWIAQNGLDLMRSFPPGKPWHLVVNFTGPHNPMDITARMESLCRGRTFPQPVAASNEKCSPDQHLAIRQNYAAMIENIDRWVGIYLEELERRGELENTLIVYSSDHGEMLGNHDLWGKNQPYHPSVGVPMIVAGPGVSPGVTSHALVSLIDLTATFLEYAGAVPVGDMQGRSLRPLLQGDTDTHREHVLSGLQAWRMVFDGQFKLITGHAPDPLLFDWLHDPDEVENVAERHPYEVKRLASLLSETGS